MCGWSCPPGWTGGAAGSGGAATRPARRRWRCWPGCGRRGRVIPGARMLTVGDWLAHWLVTRTATAPSTVRGYAAHVRLYLTPVPGGGAAGRADRRAGAGDVHRDHPPAPRPGHAGLGRHLDPDPRHPAGRAERRDPPRAAHARTRPPSAELPRARRPRAVVWTPYRIEQWRRTGERPPVAVWTAAQTAQFLRRDRGAPAVCRLPSDRAARAAPRRGRRAALVRYRPGRQDRGDLPAAAAIRRAPGDLPAQDPAQQPGHRLGPHDRRGAARSPRPAAAPRPPPTGPATGTAGSCSPTSTATRWPRTG